LDKLLAKSSNTSITLSVLIFSSFIYDFNEPFFDKNPNTFIFLFSNVLTTAVVPIGVHNFGIFEL
jgi:hypothetical protein